MAPEEINTNLIKRMHDEYMQELEQMSQNRKDYYQMAKDQKEPMLMMNARLYQGKESALFHVINDLRHILNLDPIGEDSNSFGYIFDVE